MTGNSSRTRRPAGGSNGRAPAQDIDMHASTHGQAHISVQKLETAGQCKRKNPVWLLPVVCLCSPLLGAAPAQGVLCNDGEYVPGAVRNPSFEEYFVPNPTSFFYRDVHCPTQGTECEFIPHWKKKAGGIGVTVSREQEVYPATYGKQTCILNRYAEIQQNVTMEPLTEYDFRVFGYSVWAGSSTPAGPLKLQVDGATVFRAMTEGIAWTTARFTTSDKTLHEIAISQDGGGTSSGRESLIVLDLVEIKKVGGDTCVPCRRGYASQGVFCDDVDECALPGTCEHAECTNSDGSFACACNAGFSWLDGESRCAHTWTDGSCWFDDHSLPHNNLSDAWRWPVGAADHPVAVHRRDYAWNGSAAEAVAFVSTVSFPLMHQGRIPDGVLFEVGGSSGGLWAGILGNQLHIQAGSAAAAPQQGAVANSTSYLTTECVPADGAAHMVVVDLDWKRAGHLRLWIDRMFVAQGVDMAQNRSDFTESGAPWVGYGVGAGSVPVGTVGNEWIGELHHELLVYPGRTVGGCEVQAPAIVCAACTDGVQNGREEHVDCGGSCGECDPCKRGDAPVGLRDASFDADGDARREEEGGWIAEGAQVVRSQYTCSELRGRLVGGLCLVLSPVKFASWFGAEAECRALGGHLASIGSADDNEEAWDVYVASGFSDDVRVHIGLTNHPSMLNSTVGRACDGQPPGSPCNPHGNGLAWADGAEVRFLNVRGGGTAARSCAALARRAEDEAQAWELGSCWEELPFLCGVPTVERDDAAGASPCEALGGVQAPGAGTCFVASKTALAWQAAEEECEGMGGHLASVKSLAEHRMASALRMRLAVGEAWIGLSCDEAVVEGASAADGVWKWVDGSTWTFTKWPEGHAHNPAAMCAAMSIGAGVDEGSSAWMQLGCGAQRGFVCAVETGPPPPPTYTCNATCERWECEEDTESAPELVLVGSSSCSSGTYRFPQCQRTLTIVRDVDVSALLVTVTVEQIAFSGAGNRVDVRVEGLMLPYDNLMYGGQSRACGTWKTVMNQARLPDELTSATSLNVRVITNFVSAITCNRRVLNARIEVYGVKKPPPICRCSKLTFRGAMGSLRSLDSSFAALLARNSSISQPLQLVRAQRYHLRFLAAASQCEQGRGGALRVLLQEQELVRVQPELARFEAFEVLFVAEATGPLRFVNDGEDDAGPVFVDAVELESRCPYAGDAGVDDMAGSCGVFRNLSSARPSLLHYEFGTAALLRDSSLFGRHAAVHRGTPVSTMAGCARGGCVYLGGAAALKTGRLRLDGREAGLTIGMWWRCDGAQAADAVLLELRGAARSGGVDGVRITVAAEGRAERLRLEHAGGHAEVFADGELASGRWQQLRWAVSWQGWKVWLGSRLVAVREGTSVPDMEVHEGFVGGSGAGRAAFRGWVDEVRVEPQAEHGDHAYMFHALDAGRFGLDASVKGRHLPPPASGVWSPEPQRECMFGSCAKVGAGQYLQLPAMQINSVLNGLTVSLWYRREGMEAEEAWAVLLDMMGEANGRERIRFLLNLDDPRMLAALVEGVVDLVVNDEAVAAPGWHHVSLVVSVTAVRLSVDGVTAQWDGIAPPMWTMQHGRVGAASVASAQRINGMPLQPFAGWVDELGIHDAPCSQILPSCPDGWQQVASSGGVARCLLAVDAPATFDAAAAACAAMDAHLPMVSSQEDSEAILELAKQSAWLGATVGSDGGLRWLDHTVATLPEGVAWNGSSGDASAKCLQVSGHLSCGEPSGPCLGFAFASSTLKNGAHETESSGCSACAGSSALVLDGVDDFLDLGTLEFGLNLSYTAWVRADAAVNNATVFDFGNESNANNHILAFDATAHLAFVTTAGSTTAQITSPSVLPVKQWVHVAVTIAGTTARLYIDGAEVVSGPVFNLPVQNRSRCYVGKGSSKHAGLFNGSIADFRVYRRAMRAAEVAAIRAGSSVFSEETLTLAGVSCHGRVAQCNTTTWWEKRACNEVAKVVCQSSLRCAGERESTGAKCLSCECAGCATRRRMCEGDPRGQLKPQDPYHIAFHTVGFEKLLAVARQDVRDAVGDLYRDAGLLVEACDGHGRAWCLPTPPLHGTFDIRFPTSTWERQRETVRAAGHSGVAFVKAPSRSQPNQTEAGEEEGDSGGDVELPGSNEADAGGGDGFEAAYGAAAGGAAATVALAVWYYRRKRREAMEAVKAAGRTVRVRLVLVREGREVGEVPLEAGQEVTFGRDGEAALRVEHESCSRAHALFRLSADAALLTVTDLASQNGTRVDGRRLPPRRAEAVGNGQNVVLAASPTVLLVAGLPDVPSQAPSRGSDCALEMAPLRPCESATASSKSSLQTAVSGSIMFDVSRGQGRPYRGWQQELRKEGAWPADAGARTPEFWMGSDGQMHRARSVADAAEEDGGTEPLSTHETKESKEWSYESDNEDAFRNAGGGGGGAEWLLRGPYNGAGLPARSEAVVSSPQRRKGSTESAEPLLR